MVGLFLFTLNQYNENSAWKIGLAISDDVKWMERYLALWKEIERRLDVVLKSVVENDVSMIFDPKLIIQNLLHGKKLLEQIFMVLIYHSVEVWKQILCYKFESLTGKVENITHKFLSKNVASQKTTFRLNNF